MLVLCFQPDVFQKLGRYIRRIGNHGSALDPVDDQRFLEVHGVLLQFLDCLLDRVDYGGPGSQKHPDTSLGRPLTEITANGCNLFRRRRVGLALDEIDTKPLRPSLVLEDSQRPP